MQLSFVSNSDTQLVLVPTNEVERHLLKSLLSDEVEVRFLQNHMSILGQNLNGGIIIRKKASSVTGDAIIDKHHGPQVVGLDMK